jgi:hypothetical protein
MHAAPAKMREGQDIDSSSGMKLARLQTHYRHAQLGHRDAQSGAHTLGIIE